jgi:hypothetical protein
VRHFRATTRVGNPYHHSCYARNVPFLSKIHNHYKKLSDYGNISKIRRKNFYLEKLNSKI